jgi:hypothetical protein
MNHVGLGFWDCKSASSGTLLMSCVMVLNCCAGFLFCFNSACYPQGVLTCNSRFLNSSCAFKWKCLYCIVLCTSVPCSEMAMDYQRWIPFGSESIAGYCLKTEIKKWINISCPNFHFCYPVVLIVTERDLRVASHK